MKAFTPCFLLLALTSLSALAGPRTSANYSIANDTTDGAGRRATSANYSHDGSLGGSVATATSSAVGLVAKAGYIGQLTEVAGLLVTSGSTTVNENGTLQLGVSQLLDDATTLTLNPASVTWSVVSGPLSSISTGGLANAGAVYQNTPATARAEAGVFVGTLNLSVLDVLPDNFGSYAGDGIDDSWQFQYFGLNNPNAAPNVDASGTGQNNLFKFVAGLDPLDPAARFRVQTAPVVGQPGQQRLTFSPVLAGRVYSVRAAPNLTGGGWTTLPGSVQINGSEGTFTDLNATGPRKFYEVQITR